MKHFHSLLSILIAVIITLSAVVFPAAERSAIPATTDSASITVRNSTDLIRKETNNSADEPTSVRIPAHPVPDPEPFSVASAAEEEPSSTGSVSTAAVLSPAAQPPSVAISDLSGDDAVSEAADDDFVTVAAVRKKETAVTELSDKKAAALLKPTDRNAAKTTPRNQTEIPTIDKYIPLQFDSDYTDTFSSADERHIYTFTVKERGYIRYSIRHAELKNFRGWEATLYRAYYLNGADGEIGYMPMNLLKTTALNTNEASPSLGLMPGEYRIVIKTSSGVPAEEYCLQAVFTAATNHEIECNDTKAAYTELYAGIPMIGSASCYSDKQDDDWYLLRARSNGKLRIVFTHAESNSVSVAWRVVLYNTDGTEIYSENSGMNTETIDSGEIGLEKGCYFIAVLCRTRCDADYTLTATMESDEHFERESNDSADLATPIEMGSMISGCVTAKAGKLDRDFYRFEMTSRGNFSLVFTHPPAALKDDKNGWNIRLLNASGTLLYGMVSTWNASSDKMPVMGLEAGVYFIEINSEDMYRSTLTYTLIAGGNESSGFETEPNNTIATANYIAQGVPVSGAIIDAAAPDDDFYSFTVSAYSRVTVMLRHEVNTSQRDIFRFSVCDAAGERFPLYSGRELQKDAEGNNVYYVSSLGTQQSVTGYYELSPGTYYIKVTSGRFVDSINYTIEFYIN